MHPELFEIPLIHVTLKSYGLMMVIGFLAAVTVIRHLSRDITPDPQHITNAALYSLIAGVLGARAFYVIHHFDQYRDDLPSVFAIWQGGLELLGGVILAIVLIFFYLVYHKLPIRRYLDILAIGLMLALASGRIGCFLNGCCFGKPTDLPWAVRFPYASFAYRSQVEPDPDRNRPAPHMELPDSFFTYAYNSDQSKILKSYGELTEQQKTMLKESDKLRSLPVHPTQLYSSAAGVVLSLVLYLFWRRAKNAPKSKDASKVFIKPGCTFSLMFVLYGVNRFLIEFLRDDNPFEFDSVTIAQIIGVGLIAAGVILMVIFCQMRVRPRGR
jgi:phosphatidylglycerol:prolipoprotein diacylglycerol transferase